MSQIASCASYINHDELPEDFAVTLQVALVGIDGIVIASDRLLVEQRTLLRRGTYYADRHSQQAPGTKIVFGDHVACTFAGGPNAERIARAIQQQGDPQGASDASWRTQVERISEAVPGADSSVIDEVIVLRLDDRSAFKLMRQGGLNPSITPITAHLLAGDVVRQANFLPTHLWRKDMSTEELSVLALLTVAYATAENPSGIGGGADLLIAKKGQAFSVSQYPEETLREMRERFNVKIFGALEGLSLEKEN
jgi:hypothetical protein